MLKFDKRDMRIYNLIKIDVNIDEEFDDGDTHPIRDNTHNGNNPGKLDATQPTFFG